MSETEQISLALPLKTVQFIHSKVASGDYSSISALVEESIELLQRQDVESDEWIRTEVLPALAEYDADRSTGLTLEQMRLALASDHG